MKFNVVRLFYLLALLVGSIGCSGISKPSGSDSGTDADADTDC